MSSAMNITDDEIIAAVNSWNASAWTYVIKNILRQGVGRSGLKTAYILTRLDKLAREGRVFKVRSDSAVHLNWSTMKDAQS